MSKGPHNALYDLRRWRRRARMHKQQHPLCERCEAEGRVMPAEVSHHLIEHKGQMHAFDNSPLQSLCREHHRLAHGGKPKRRAIGLDGFPIIGSEWL